MQQPILPSGWDELTWEQLRQVHHIIAEHSANRSIRNLELYLYLADLEIVEGEGEIKDNGDIIYYLRKRTVHPGVKFKLANMARSLLRLSSRDEEFFTVKVDDLALYLNGCHLESTSGQDDESTSKVSEKLRKRVERAGALDWVDQPVGKNGQGGLVGLPEDEIRIGKRMFILPSMLVTNMTYEQYSNLQKLQQAVWTFTEQVQEMQKEFINLTRPDDNEPVQEGEVRRVVSNIESAMKEVRKYRMQFLAHALVEKATDQKGVVTSEYKSNVAEVLTPYMEKYAPDWLFDILVQHLQSSLGLYKTQFPELFSKDGGEGRDVIPLVSEVETINAIQKWQGYQEQQKVYDTNAVFIFGILNSMTKEAKAIEEANNKMKSHRK